MLTYIEITGRTEEEALARGLAQLGLERDDVSVEILERGKSGFLGIGSVPARVKLTYEVPDAPAAEPEPVSVADRPPEEPVKEPPAPVDEVVAAIRSFQTGLLAHMGVSATPVVTRMDDAYQVVLEGADVGALIGRRGETLDAIQQLTGYAVNRHRGKRVRIHVDAEGYRARREESLKRLAEKTAAKVTRYRRNVMLEAMNAYERHIIHTALQEVPHIATYSTGTEPNRRTVVAYDPNKK